MIISLLPHLLRILTHEYELRQRSPVYPVKPFEDRETRQHPPRVAHIRKFLRSTVESPGFDLSFAQPPPQQIGVHVSKPPTDGQRTDAREDLPRVRLTSGRAPEPAVEIFTAGNESHGLVHVNRVYPTDELAARQRAVREASVYLAPLVPAKEGSRSVTHTHTRRQRAFVCLI